MRTIAKKKKKKKMRNKNNISSIKLKEKWDRSRNIKSYPDKYQSVSKIMRIVPMQIKPNK